MTEPLLAIGAFSRASLLSIKALRLYHREGLLVPAHVDPATGYRSYDAGQLVDAATIRRLRDLDVPLPAIREVLTARTPEVTARVLTGHTAAMRARLTELEHIVGELVTTTPEAETPVHLRTLPAQRALAVSDEVAEQDYGAFMEQAYGRLWTAMTGADIAPAGPAGALYPAEILDETGPVTAYVPVAAEAAVPDGVLELRLPEVAAAVIVHHGSYDGIAPTYAALGAWVAHNAQPAADPVREVYLVSYDDGVDPSDFRTEVCWPVHR